MGDAEHKRRGTYESCRSDAAIADPKASRRRSPLLKIVPKSYPRIGEKTLLKAIKSLPGYDPYVDKGDTWFDWKAAKKAVDFFHKELSHVKGDLARRPFFLEKWEIGIIANLFGWKNPDGTRRFQEAFVFVPRKNGKTPLSAGIILYMLLEDGEAGAELYGAGASHGQACFVFDHARGMVLQNEKLRDRCKVLNGFNAKCIDIPETFSAYKVIASDADTQHGQNASGAVADELHAWKPGSDLLEILETAMAGRSQPLLFTITTSDYERPGSVCNAKYDEAVKIRDGITKDRTFLPVIYEASAEDDWTDPKVWAKANPNLGVSVNMAYMKKKCKKAQETPSFENTFKRLHLNIRTEQDVRWLPMDLWDGCTGTVDLEALKLQSCWAGLDLASTSDITAFVMMFPDGDAYKMVPICWVPKDCPTRKAAKEKKSYEEWIRLGFMRETPGNMTDYNIVRRDINELAKQHVIEEIAVDMLFQGRQMATDLAGDGFKVTAFGQGWRSMAAPTLDFETLVQAGRLHHGGHPVARWMASNVSVKLDPAGNMKPDKEKSANKIDIIVGGIMALGCAMISEGSSDYADGLVFV